jgi:hypothetical protein
MYFPGCGGEYNRGSTRPRSERPGLGLAGSGSPASRGGRSRSFALLAAATERAGILPSPKGVAQTFLYFTRNGQPALTSAFGTFFIGNHPVDGQSLAGLARGGDFNFIDAGFTQPAFLGHATVDSATGALVPAINEIVVDAGGALINTYLDNFTFATPVAPVPEANAWVLLAATTLAAVCRARRRAAAP